MTDSPPSPSIRHCCVDEAGDPKLFKGRGNVIVGKDVCASYFKLGIADFTNPIQVGGQLTELRNNLFADRYLKGVPSLDPAGKESAKPFHAQDDLSLNHYP